MRTRRNLAIDAVVLAVYLLAANPLLTGIAVHEWVSLGFALVGAIHLALHREWLSRTVRRLTRRLAHMSRLHLALDAFTAAVVVALTVSGLAMSRYLPALVGLTGSALTAWTSIHSISATALVAAVLAHLALHWRWLQTAARLHIVAPIAAAVDGSPTFSVGARLAAWGVPALLAATALMLGALGMSSSGPSAAGFYPAGTSAGGTLTCPATGCTASSCHTAGGGSASAQALPQVGSGSSAGATLTCPRTGCTATSCHATSSGRGGRHRGGFGTGS